MKFDRNGIKRRRKERINIRETLSDTPQQQLEITKSVGFEKRPNKIRTQIFASLILFALVYVTFQTNQKWASSFQGFVREAIDQDYNFARTAQWIEEALGQFPALIPTLNLKKEEAIPVFSRPLEGTVVNVFASNHAGVIIESGVKSEVHPIGTGWVRYVGKKTGTGNTVIIQHGDGKESIYGFLGEIYVRKDDWVYPETKLGIVDEQSLFLQIREKDQYLNPMDVITFD